MAKTRSQKEAMLDSYLKGIEESQAIVLVDTSNLSTDQITEVKLKIFELGGTFAVLKNKVFEKAVEKSDLSGANLGKVAGPTGIFFINGDLGAIAKVLKEFQKEYELMETKVGTLDGELLTNEQIKQIADLPTRDELLAKTVYVIAGPVRNLLGVMNGATRDLVGVLKAIQDAKQSA